MPHAPHLPASPRRRGLLQAGAALLVAGPALGQALPPGRRVPPVLRVPDATLPLELARVAIDTQLAGRVARTRIELEIRNPNPQVLEGELQFPLQAGQSVVGFALDIDGELRPAVPVDKARGRQVFEDVVRARVDPALLESTGGNQHKLRVYPLPPRGSRRVVLELAETLARERSGGRDVALLQLPVQLGMRVGRIEAVVRVPRTPGTPAPTGHFGAQRLDVQREPGGGWSLHLARQGYQGSDTLQVAVPQPAQEAQVVAQVFRDATYFLAELPFTQQERPRPAPRRLALLWDASGSAQQRDRSRELALLDAYFQTVRDLEVDLLVVRDVAEPLQRHAVRGGDWTALREQLRGLAYDGATRLDAFVVPEGADLALLVSDGLGTYGEGGLPPSPVPLYAAAASASGDPARLRDAAERTGGLLLDLTRLDPREAAARLRRQRTRVLSAEGADVEDVVFDSRLPEQDRLVVAGRLRAPSARLTLHLQLPDGTLARRTVPITSAATPTTAPGLPVAAYRWATLRLAELEADRERNRQAIRQLGLHFGLPTSGTSLIVLDRVEDYVRHGIEPPASLRPAYERLLAQRTQRQQGERHQHLERVVQRFAERQAWWERAFPKDGRPKPSPQEERRAAQERAARARAGVPAPGATPPRPAPLRMAPPPAPPAAMAAPAPRSGAAAAGPAATATIALQPWRPDAPHARRLREAPVEQLYAVYLDERQAHANSTAFYLDCADVLVQRGQLPLALRVLSNLAEMDLENRHVLRLLAYRLLQAGQVQVALPVLRKVLQLSPDEPQSYRDLGLALAQHGQLQAAIEQLWEVVSRPWNDRFPGIELIALAELNAIVARAQPGAVDTSALDRRLLRNLPLDLRVVLGWDADNTDIDLYVEDPDGEVASYRHRLTWQGGRLSNDFTGGYGPEEFALRHAKPGTYTVRADFYGHRQQVVAPSTTLMVRFTTGFGTAAQKDVDTVVRLTREGRQVLLGTFTVEAPRG